MSLNKRLFTYVISLSALLLSIAVPAQNMQKLGSLDVHYIAINSTFLTPDIAKTYGITRSKINALINISVLDNSLAGKPTKTANVYGTATNLLGQSKTLEFVEVKEGDAIYYLAELNFSNEEIFRFDIKINTQDSNETLKFQHKFYVD
ncbi:DUF4426 domain-containing protein [Thalassotalea agariperforans]